MVFTVFEAHRLLPGRVRKASEIRSDSETLLRPPFTSMLIRFEGFWNPFWEPFWSF